LEINEEITKHLRMFFNYSRNKKETGKQKLRNKQIKKISTQEKAKIKDG
jgi:hypothetical protein